MLREHERLIAECGRTAWLTKDRKAAVDKLNKHSLAVKPILGHFNLSGIGGETRLDAADPDTTRRARPYATDHRPNRPRVAEVLVPLVDFVNSSTRTGAPGSRLRGGNCLVRAADAARQR